MTDYNTDYNDKTETSDKSVTPNETAKPGAPVLHEAVPSKRPLISLTRKQLQITTASAAVVLVLALGYFVWYKPNRPDAVLARSLMNTLQLQSSQFKMAGDVSPGNSFQLGGSASSKGTFDVQGSYKTKSGTIQLQALSADGQDIYVKLTGLSGLGAVLGPQAAQYGISPTANPFQGLEGTWLQITKDSKDALLKNTQADVGGTISSGLNADDKKRVATAYQKHPFILVTKVLADESIQGVASRHYQAKVDKPALEAFVKEVKTDVPTLKLDDQEVASVQRSVIPSQPFDAWVAKDSGYISQIRYANAKSATSLQLNLSNYNQPVKATKPQNAKPLFEALSSLLLGS